MVLCLKARESRSPPGLSDRNAQLKPSFQDQKSPVITDRAFLIASVCYASRITIFWDSIMTNQIIDAEFLTAEVDRIIAHRNQKSSEPTRPDRSVFESFPAFQRAYQGEMGYLWALHDIFGRNGNMTYLMSLGVPCSGAPYGGVENNTKYGVAVDHFVVLYTKMSEQDRANFRNAFDNFVLRDLPDIKQSAPWHADELLEPMAWLATTIQHGSGIIEDKPRLFAAWDAATRELSALLRNKPVLPGTRPSTGLRFSDYDPHAVLRAT